MIDYHGLEQRLSEALGHGRRPVAVTFRDTPPAGGARFSGSEPSGCSFWRLTAAGQGFLHCAERPLQLRDRQPYALGNRVYTDLGEDELYVAVSGKDLARITDQLQTIVAANAALSEYHRGRRLALTRE